MKTSPSTRVRSLGWILLLGVAGQGACRSAPDGARSIAQRDTIEDAGADGTFEEPSLDDGGYAVEAGDDGDDGACPETVTYNGFNGENGAPDFDQCAGLVKAGADVPIDQNFLAAVNVQATLESCLKAAHCTDPDASGTASPAGALAPTCLSVLTTHGNLTAFQPAAAQIVTTDCDGDGGKEQCILTQAGRSGSSLVFGPVSVSPPAGPACDASGNATVAARNAVLAAYGYMPNGSSTPPASLSNGVLGLASKVAQFSFCLRPDDGGAGTCGKSAQFLAAYSFALSVGAAVDLGGYLSNLITSTITVAAGASASCKGLMPSETYNVLLLPVGQVIRGGQVEAEDWVGPYLTMLAYAGRENLANNQYASQNPSKNVPLSSFNASATAAMRGPYGGQDEDSFQDLDTTCPAVSGAATPPPEMDDAEAGTVQDPDAWTGLPGVPAWVKAFPITVLTIGGVKVEAIATDPCCRAEL
jgi:hypothetical protein